MLSTQRSMVTLDENINNVMNQIGVQLSSCFDTLIDMLDLEKGYAMHESETLLETIKSRRSVITAESRSDEVLCQEHVVLEVIESIALISEQYPELKANENYLKIMDSVDSCENMVRTSLLIYNDNVTKLNQSICMFPASMIAGIMGFHKRDYLMPAELGCAET